MISLKDQIGHLVEFKQTPKRIISLVPSQTELLYDLGADCEVIGITKFCIHPQKWKKNKTIIGGTKNIHHDKIARLKPDLIIANKEENTKEDIQKLQEHFQVYTSDIFTVKESFKMMEDLGLLLNKQNDALSLIQAIKTSFESLNQATHKTVAYLIWQNPYMLAGKHTFIQSMLEIAGFSNILKSDESRYPEVAVEELRKLNSDFIFLSSEPFPFKQKHLSEIENQTQIKTVLVDGEMFSWYGSRMLKFSDYIRRLDLFK
jgi:ABC-type Fe3+-hydroxamate transport system substrate-binding protein